MLNFDSKAIEDKEDEKQVGLLSPMIRLALHVWMR